MQQDEKEVIKTIPSSFNRRFVSGITHGLGVAVDVGMFGVELGFGIAKYTTRTSLQISKQIVNGIGRHALGESITSSLDGALSLAEILALEGIELGHFCADFGMVTVQKSTSGVNHVAGNTETALALEEFLALLRREVKWNGLDALSTVEIIRSVMAWNNLQSYTRSQWNRKMEASCTILDVVYEPIDDPYSDTISLLTQTDTMSIAELGFPNMTPPQHPVDMVTSVGLVQDLVRYMRFSSGAYGSVFLKFLRSGLPLPDMQRFTNIVDGPGTLQGNHEAFAKFAGIESRELIHSSTFSSSRYSSEYLPTFFLLFDHAEKQVALALRGTLSFHDLMIDLTCEPVDFVYRGQQCSVHQGMLKVAQSIAKEGHFANVFETVKAGLEKYPDYNLLITGHSLGAGFAVLLTIIWCAADGKILHSSGLPRRKIRCFAFACPQVVSYNLMEMSKEFITTLVTESDCVPRLGLASARDLMRVIVWLKEHPEHHDSLFNAPSDVNPEHWDLRHCISQECMTNEQILFPGGRVLWIQNRVLMQVDDYRQVFGQILLSPKMINDHHPTAYEDALNTLIQIH